MTYGPGSRCLLEGQVEIVTPDWELGIFHDIYDWDYGLRYWWGGTFYRPPQPEPCDPSEGEGEWDAFMPHLTESAPVGLTKIEIGGRRIAYRTKLAHVPAYLTIREALRG